MTLTRDEWLGQSKLNYVVHPIGGLIRSTRGLDGHRHRHHHHHHHRLQNNRSSETLCIQLTSILLILILPHASRFGPFLPPQVQCLCSQQRLRRKKDMVSPIAG